MTEQESENTIERIGKEYAKILLIVENTLDNLRNTKASNSELAAAIMARLAQQHFVWECISE